MKIRSGFVSNSSSSSFVLRVREPFYQPLNVARYMISKRGFDDDAELVEKVNKMILSCPTIPSVCFNSCNYDTFIAKMDRLFLVETCHNHNWGLDNLYVPCPPEYGDYFGDDSFYNLPHCIDFYHLNYDIKGRPVSYREMTPGQTYCGKQDCYGSKWWVGETIRCVRCGEQFKNERK